MAAPSLAQQPRALGVHERKVLEWAADSRHAYADQLARTNVFGSM